MTDLIDFLSDSDYYLDINGVSKHLGTDYKYNENLTPIILPKIGLGNKNYGGLNLMFAPETKQNPNTLMLNYSIPLK